MAMDIKGMLTKKLGPLPAWGWGLVLGGGYLGYRVISGKGISLSGTSTDAATTDEAASYEGTGTNGSSAGYAYGEGGEVPDVYVTVVPDTTTSDASSSDTASAVEDLSSKLATSKTYGKKMKTRGDNWANYARKWRKAAKKKDSSNAKAGSTKPKTENNAKSKRTGTQGTHIVEKKARSPIDRSQNLRVRKPAPKPQSRLHTTKRGGK
jgi:hypothetical protein